MQYLWSFVWLRASRAPRITASFSALHRNAPSVGVVLCFVFPLSFCHSFVSLLVFCVCFGCITCTTHSTFPSAPILLPLLVPRNSGCGNSSTPAKTSNVIIMPVETAFQTQKTQQNTKSNSNHRGSTRRTQPDALRQPRVCRKSGVCVFVLFVVALVSHLWNVLQRVQSL
jgi:hypothetical protein